MAFGDARRAMTERWLNAERWYTHPWGIWIWLTKPSFRQRYSENSRNKCEKCGGLRAESCAMALRIVGRWMKASYSSQRRMADERQLSWAVARRTLWPAFWPMSLSAINPKNDLS